MHVRHVHIIPYFVLKSPDPCSLSRILLRLRFPECQYHHRLNRIHVFFSRSIVITIMCRASLLLFFIMMIGWSFCEDLNFFSSNNDISFDEIEPNLSNGLFSESSESNIDDDLFVTDDLLNVEQASSPTESVHDEFFAAADDASKCSSFSPSRKIRARSAAADSCSTNPERYLDVRTDEDVKKYWCSESGFLGFANIPVCNLSPNTQTTSNPNIWADPKTSPPPVGFYTLPVCRIRKFHFFFIYVKCMWGTFEFSRSCIAETIPESFWKFSWTWSLLQMKNNKQLTFERERKMILVTPLNYIICDDDLAYCCQSVLSLYTHLITYDVGVGYFCVRAFRKASHPYPWFAPKNFARWTLLDEQTIYLYIYIYTREKAKKFWLSTKWYLRCTYNTLIVHGLKNGKIPEWLRTEELLSPVGGARMTLGGESVRWWAWAPWTDSNQMYVDCSIYYVLRLI